jgi:glucokinase
MRKLLLAGDIGGTKTILAIYAAGAGGRLSKLREATFPSRQYDSLEKIVGEFIGAGRERVRAAAFGVAGPVIEDRVKTTNLPWVVRSRSMTRLLGSPRVRLMNDLEATAYGGLFLKPQQIEWLARGKRRRANVAVLAAGTGLGQAFLFWDGERHHPVATEGGHVDFAPRNDKEIALLVFLQKRFARVSYERLLSGPGLVSIFRFFDEEVGRPVSASVRDRMKREDPAAVIGEAGVAGSCAASVDAVETFVSIYGAQAGNLALTVFGVGGVLLGGGIAIKMLPKLKAPRFLEAFRDKGRYVDFMSQIPVGVMLDAKAALVGAAHAAAELAH